MKVKIIARVRVNEGDVHYPLVAPAYHPNGKIKAGHAVIAGQEVRVSEVMHYAIRFTEDGKRRIENAGRDPVEAQNAAYRKETELRAKRLEFAIAVPGVNPTTRNTGKTPVADAVKKYFANLEARGLDHKSIKACRKAVDEFVASYKKPFIEDYEPQDMIDFMGYLRKQPVPKRKHGNADRTYNNKCSHVAIFLKACGVKPGLKKSEYPQFSEKVVTAHTDEELEFLYGHSDAEETFLLDYFLGCGFRDAEASHAEYSDLKGNVIEVKRKPWVTSPAYPKGFHPKKHHCRTVAIPQSLADSIRARGKASGSKLIFPNGGGNPNLHLLRDLQTIAERNGAEFHTELHKLRKTWATRLAVNGVPLHELRRMLGQKSLAVTQKYLADVDLTQGKMREAVETAAYVPKPKLVKAG